MTVDYESGFSKKDLIIINQGLGRLCSTLKEGGDKYKDIIDVKIKVQREYTKLEGEKK